MATSQPKGEQNFARFPGVDPYIDWALGAGRSHYFLPGRQSKWVPVLLRLKGISPAAFAQGGSFIKRDDERVQWQASLRISPFSTNFRDDDADMSYCAAMTTSDFFDFVRDSPSLREVLAGLSLGLPLDSESLPSGDARKPGDRP